MASRIYYTTKIIIPNTQEMGIPKFCQLITASRFYCCGASFTSKYNHKILYPNHSGIDQTVTPPTGDEFSGFIPVNKLDITYSRSRGPGGQHVNIANTKVDLRFHLNKATWIYQLFKRMCFLKGVYN